MDTAPESPANVATLERPPSLLSASTSEAAGESSVAVEPRPQELRRLQGGARLHVQGDGEEQSVEAQSLIVATGSVPAQPPIPGTELEGVVNRDRLLQLGRIPGRLGVVGAGAVGLEWADIFGPL